MKHYKSSLLNVLYFIYRLVSPLCDPIKLFYGLIGYPRFFLDLIKFRSMNPGLRTRLIDIYPILNERTSTTYIDKHYLYQQIWTFEHVQVHTPQLHIDVASRYELAAYVSTLVPTEFVDIRPVTYSLPNLKIVNGDILSLPYADASISSVSCLHVIEHIGLGRYGDRVDPNAYLTAVSELKRVVSPGGILYVSVPVGRERTYFNAHRVFHPNHILQLLKEFELKEFSAVTDEGQFLRKIRPEDLCDSNYALGMYKLEKKQ